jgi:NAD(P)-dependent dehydrogenase (short-subunit alcohol dehydrogenase family)
MDADLSGQVALITGGGRGIGRALAEGFARAGAAVAVTARTPSQVEETAAAIEAVGGRALAVPGDVTNQQDMERLVRETESWLGAIDLLVNNAGVVEQGGPMWEVDPEAWRRTIDVNLVGPFLTIRAVLPGMLRRGRGRIINVSSGAGIMPGGFTGFSAYGASKVGLNRITETLASEAKAFGISVFAVGPGVIRTDMLREVVSERLEKMAPGRAARMWATNDSFEPITSLCLQLASGAADNLSGRYLSVRDDLPDLISRADEIRARDLYTMRINKL